MPLSCNTPLQVFLQTGSPTPAEDDSEKVKEAEESNNFIKKCRYYDKGDCKYQRKCRYFHPKEICKSHLQNLNCKLKGCRERHPKACKWFQRDVGCKRTDCEFLHIVGTENHLSLTDFKCAGCENVWKDENCVIKHDMQNKEVFFCLNFDDWIVWTLLDEPGNLRIV